MLPVTLGSKADSDCIRCARDWTDDCSLVNNPKLARNPRAMASFKVSAMAVDDAVPCGTLCRNCASPGDSDIAGWPGIGGGVKAGELFAACEPWPGPFWPKLAWGNTAPTNAQIVNVLTNCRGI